MFLFEIDYLNENMLRKVRGLENGENYFVSVMGTRDIENSELNLLGSIPVNSPRITESLIATP
jgi:hypothetical protein